MKSRFRTIGILCALLLTGALFNPSNAVAHAQRAREMCGILQGIDLNARTLTVQSPKRGQPATFAIKSDTKFIKDWRFSDADLLKEGLRACVYYRSPFFGKPFVTKVVWVDRNESSGKP